IPSNLVVNDCGCGCGGRQKCLRPRPTVNRPDTLPAPPPMLPYPSGGVHSRSSPLSPLRIRETINRVWAYIQPENPTLNGRLRAEKIVRLLVRNASRPGSAMDNDELNKTVMKLAVPSVIQDEEPPSDSTPRPGSGMGNTRLSETDMTIPDEDYEEEDE